MASIIIIGAGAIGTFLGARLHRSGHDVTLVARGERLHALKANGLRLEINGAFEQMSLPATEALGVHQPADLVVLATKTAGMDDALRLAEPVVSRSTAILTVQNGVETADAVAAHFPQATVFASRIHGFFQLDGDNVRHVGVEPSVEFGAIANDPGNLGEQLRTMLNQADIAAARAPDIRACLWEKLLLAAPLGGVALAYGISAGRLRHDAAAWAMLGEAMHEVETLAHAHGIALAPDIVARTLAFVATFPNDATSSLQRDVLNGKPSEYSDLTGAIPRLAEAVGRVAPCFTRIDTLIRERGLLLP